MNILLINHYAGSPIYGMEYRPYYLAKEWVKLGHNVTIVAASEAHVRQKKIEVNGNRSEEWINGIRYIWLKTSSYDGNGARRALNMFSFVRQLFTNSNYFVNTCKPDVVISSSTYPLDIYPARTIARKSKARFLFEVHDLWPLSPMELGGMKPWHPFIFIMQRAENYAYRHADQIISMLPKAKHHMIEHGMKAHKFTYIPNGINIDEWDNMQQPLNNEHYQVLCQLKDKGHFIIGYAGAHGIANALHTLIDAAIQLESHPVTFVLVGNGPEKENLKKKVAQKALNNILFLPSISKKEIPSFLALTDVLYIGLQNQSLFRFGVSPNKLMDYMMAAKPIIHSIDAGNDLVAESGCGISIPPEDPAAIVDAAKKLLDMDATKRIEMGLLGRRYVLEYHDYRVLAENFADAMKQK